MREKPSTVAEYLKALTPEKRAALRGLRKQIRAAAPGAEECISYGIPAFRLRGRLLVGFGAAANHCSFYAGAAPIRIHGRELAGWGTSKGTIRFLPGEPLPPALVRRLVKTRIAEHHPKLRARRKRPRSA